MSVVNAMLRELESRQQQEPVVAGLATARLPVPSTAATRPLSPQWLLALTVIALIAFAIVFWRWQHRDISGSRADQAPRQTIVGELAPATAPIAVAGRAASRQTPTPLTTTLRASEILAPPTPPEASANNSDPLQPTSIEKPASPELSTRSETPASIGWELVAPEPAEDNDGWAIGEQESQAPYTPRHGVDEPARATATAPISGRDAPAKTARFDRQPAQAGIEEQLQLLRQQARGALAAGDWNGADDAIQSGLALHATDPELALLRLHPSSLRNPEVAIAQAEFVLQTTPENWPVRQWLGSQHLEHKRYADAVAVLSSYAPTVLIAPDYHAILALAAQTAGAHTEAVVRYRSLIAAQPQQGRHYAGLALSLEPLGDRVAAMSAWQTALRDPELPAAVAHYGSQRLQQLQVKP